MESFVRKNKYLIAIAAICMTPQIAYSQQTFAGVRENYHPYFAVARVHVEDGNDKSTGSGTLIAAQSPGGEGLVLSCRHVCLKEGSTATVNWKWAGHESTGKVIAILDGRKRDWESDMALVETETTPQNITPVEVRTFCPTCGPWFTAGYRDGEMRVSGKMVAKLLPSGIIKVDGPLVPGMSGGPLFDRFGRLMGVCVASDFEKYGLVSDGPQMKNFLENWRND